MSIGDHLIEVCRRQNVTLRAVGDDLLEIEFDRANPPHHLIEQLRAHKLAVIRSLLGFRSEWPLPDAGD
jgi:hypothetical protein